MSFEDLGLSPEVLKAVAERGYTAPTPIQEQAIPQWSATSLGQLWHTVTGLFRRRRLPDSGFGSLSLYESTG